MRTFILVSGGLLLLAVASEPLFLGYQPATLVALFLSLSVPQKIMWLIICLAPLSLLAVALLQQFKLIGQGKIADGLKARLRGIRVDVRKLEEAQKDIDHAHEYLEHNDPEDAMSALQVRVNRAQQAIQSHQQRDQSSNLIGRVEEMRQQQQEIRDKLSGLVTQRRSLLSQLQSSQDEIERTVSAFERDDKDEELKNRVQKLSEFIRTINSRCEEIEDFMPALFQLGQKLGAIEMRIAPLDEKEAGINGVLKAVSDLGNRLTTTIARLEQDEGVSLTERIREMTATRRELEERVSNVLTQFSAIETMHKDINGLFARLNKGQRSAKPFEGVTPINFLASTQ